MTFTEYLKSINACSDAVKWAANKTVEEVVATCHRGDWLLWLASKCDIGLQPLTLAKGHCANTVRHLLKDGRTLKAVDTAIAFGEGTATREELDAAYAAADVAAYAAADVAAYAAADVDADAYYAARAAASARAAARAAASARAAAYYAAAAADADADADADAAYADAAAADAAADAAYAAAAAADAAYAYAAARDANRLQTADICRKYIGDLIIQKVNKTLNQPL